MAKPKPVKLPESKTWCIDREFKDQCKKVIQRSKQLAIEIFKPLEGKPLCTKAEFERRANLRNQSVPTFKRPLFLSYKNAVENSKPPPAKTVVSNTVASLESNEAISNSPFSCLSLQSAETDDVLTPCISENTVPSTANSDKVALAKIVDNIQTLSIQSKSISIPSESILPPTSLVLLQSYGLQTLPSLAPIDDSISSQKVTANLTDRSVNIDLQAPATVHDILNGQYRSTLEEDLQLSDSSESVDTVTESNKPSVAVTPSKQQTQTSSRRSQSRLPDILLQPIELQKHFENAKRLAVIRRKVTDTFQDSIKPKPICPTWAQFNPGLASAAPPKPVLKRARSPSVQVVNYYFGSHKRFKSQKAENQLPPQETDTTKMSRGQLRRHYQRLRKAQQ